MGDIVASSSRGKEASLSTGPRTDGLSITAGAFDGTVILFENLGVSLPEGGGAVVADGVHDDGKVRRQRGSRYYRRRIGWRAQRERIAVVTMEQELTPRPDGRFSASGQWKAAQVRLFPAQGAAKRRVGDVKVDPAPASAGGTPAGEPQVPAAEKEFSSAHHQLRYLPAAVRGSFLRIAAQPTHFYVEALRYGGDALSRHTVSGLRMDDAEAVVVIGSLQRDADAWQVEQVRYVLTHSTDVERA